MLFPLEKTRIKPGTMLIETVLSGDSLYMYSYYYIHLMFGKFSLIFKYMGVQSQNMKNLKYD